MDLLNRSGVSRETPAPFYERLAGKFRRSTHQISGYAKRWNLFSISHERTKIVDEKSRIGDWEIDTIIGKNQKQAVLSIVERVSKFTILRKLKQKTSEITKTMLTDALIKYKNEVYTITSDNGYEFARHEEISKELNADLFFAHPYSSWARSQ